MRESTRALAGLGIMALVLIGQCAGLVRYERRLPADRFGIALYIVTIVGAGLVAGMLFVRWREAARSD